MTSQPPISATEMVILFGGGSSVMIPPATAYYSFDTDTTGGTQITDRTGNGWTSTSVAGLQTAAGGAVAPSLKYLAGGDCVGVNCGIATSPGKTITTWLKMPSGFVTDGTGPKVSSAAGVAMIQVQGNDGSVSSADVATITFAFAGYQSLPFAADTWHHAAVVRSPAGVWSLYVDGVFAGTGADTSVTGITINAGGDFVSGIDEIGVWDSALSAREIAALASGRRPPNVT